MNKILVVFLTYYGDYAKPALTAIESMLKISGLPFELLVVNNGVALLPFKHPATIIAGDNSWNEFSGWQAGIKHAQKSGKLTRFAGIIIANDTIGHHNRFGWLSKYAFARSLKNIIKSKKPKAAGECWDFYTEFEVDGHRGKRWITSSLLMVNHAALAALDSLIAPNIPAAVEPDSCFANFRVNEPLKRQIQGWLGLIKLVPGKPLWYGASENRTPGYEKKIAQKASMILLEYRLSACMAEQGTELVEVFSSPVLRQLRRLEKRPLKANKTH